LFADAKVMKLFNCATEQPEKTVTFEH